MPGFTGSAAFQDIGVKAVVKDMGKFMSDLGRMDKAVQTTGQKLGTRLQGIGRGMSNIGRSMSMFVTLPIVAGGAIAVKAFADFDAAMTESLAIMTGVTDEMRDKMEKAARDVAKTTTFSAKEAAGAYYFLASAGMDAATSMEALPIVARFAQAGMFDLETATELLADAQSALGLRVKDPVKNMENLVRVSDVLTEAANASNASVMQFSEALTTKAAARLRAYNKTVEEGIAVLAVFADAGIKGTIAGERLDMVYRYLADSAIKNAEAYAAYGIAVFDASGKMRNMADIVGDFEKALAGASDQQKVMILNTLGLTAESQSGLLALLGNSEAIRTYEQRLLSAGGATETVAQKQLKTFNAQMKLLWHRVQDVFISLGKQLMPVMQDVMKVVEAAVKVFAKIVGAFAALPKPVRMVVIGLVLLAAAIGPLLMIFGQLTMALGSMIILGPIVAAKLATMIPVLIALSPWILAFIGVALILIGTAPLIIAAWGPVSEFFSNTLPAAFKAAPAAIAKMASDIVKYVANIAPQLLRAGQNIAIAIANGIASAAVAIFQVLRKIAEAIAYMLNPMNIVFGSTIEDVYAQAGTAAMGAYTKAVVRSAKKTQRAIAKSMTPTAVMPVPGDPTYEPGGKIPTKPPIGEWMPERDGRKPPVEEWMPERDEGAALKVPVDLEAGDTSALEEELPAAAEEAGADAGEEAGNAFLGMLEGIVQSGLGTITSAMAAPLDALRGVVSSLADEMMRLAGLPTVESAAERLERAQLKLELLGVKTGEKANEARKERLEGIDEEEKALLDQRQAIIDENWGREEGVEAIDAQLAALESEEDAVQNEIDAYEAELEAIEDQITALDALAEKRDLEREVMAARAQIADKTLATDAEVLAQMDRMLPVISEVTGLINQQADDLWTRFVPAWQDAAAAAGAGAGGAGGAGAEMPEMGELGELGDIGEMIDESLADVDFTAPLDKEIDKLKAWAESKGPYLVAIGATLLAFVLFGWNVGLVVAVVAAVALLIYTFRDEILAGLEWLKNFVSEHWKEVLTVFAAVTLAPLAPIIALATDAFGIRTALKKGLDKLLGFVKDKWPEILFALTALTPLGPIIALATDAFGIRTALKKGLAKVLGLVTGWAKKFGKLWEKLDIVGWVKKLPKELKKHWKKVVTGALLILFPPGAGLFAIITNFDKIKDAVIRIVGGLADRVGRLFSDLVRTVTGLVSGMVTDVKTTVSGMVTAVIGFITNLVTQVTTKVSGLVTDVTTFFSNLKTTVVTTVSELVGDIVTFFTNLPGQIVSALGTLASSIGGIAETAVSTFLGWFEGIPSAIGGFFGGIPGAIVSALGNFGQFLWDHVVQPIIDKLGDIANIELFGISLNDLIDLLGGIVNVIGTIPGLQEGLWKVAGGGTRDSVPAILAPGEMVVPQPVANVVRARVSNFAELGSLMAQNPQPAPIPPPGAVSSFGQLGGAMAGQAMPLGASRPMAMAGALSVSAPISVTVYSHDWAEVRRIVHTEVDTALSRARAQTEMAGAELSGAIG